MVMETYLILATGEIHSEIRDEFYSKGRISFAPLSAAYGCLRGDKPLEEKMKKVPEKQAEIAKNRLKIIEAQKQTLIAIITFDKKVEEQLKKMKKDE